MERKDLISIRYEKGRIIRTYKGVDFLELTEGEYSKNINTYYMIGNQRFDSIQRLMIFIESEMNNKKITIK